MEPLVNTLVSLLIGVFIGIYGHHRYVMEMGRQLMEEKTEEFQDHIKDLFDKHIMLCYSERDDKTDIIRLFEMNTNQFVCQAASGAALSDAFHARFPDKNFFLVQADEALLEELGIDPNDYEDEA